MIRQKIQNILKQCGAWVTGWKCKRKSKKALQSDYSHLQIIIFFRLVGIAALAIISINNLYKILWRGKGADWTVALLQRILKIEYRAALSIYQQMFRNNATLIWMASIGIIFLVLLRIMLRGFTKYFDMVNQGIAALLEEDAEIRLPSELYATEQKLYAVKRTLKQRTLEAELAEQRKNELVMYLAHDIRTPLTSVIGYLNLLEEAPDLPVEQRARYVHISIEKAYRLEKMINEFFEITRYNMQQITLQEKRIDLYYMLVQLADEMSPLLAERENSLELHADENLTIYGDPDKLARVFQNVLRNAAAYSFSHTAIIVTAKEKEEETEIVFQNEGYTIPKEKLAAIFEKFYRLDEGRTSKTGGAGLGLAIAREIVTQHGGTIIAESENNRVSFIIRIPGENLRKN